MIFKKDKTYDRLKTTALIMPLFITFYGTIGEIWEIPYTDKIVLTLAAMNALIGGIVKKANSDYNKTELQNIYDQEEENSLEIETGEVDEDGI